MAQRKMAPPHPHKARVSAAILVLFMAPGLGHAADPDNTIYVVGKYESGKGVLRAYDLSDSNATDQDGRTIPATAATEARQLVVREFSSWIRCPVAGKKMPGFKAKGHEARPLQFVLGDADPACEPKFLFRQVADAKGQGQQSNNQRLKDAAKELQKTLAASASADMKVLIGADRLYVKSSRAINELPRNFQGFPVEAIVNGH